MKVLEDTLLYDIFERVIMEVENKQFQLLQEKLQFYIDSKKIPGIIALIQQEGKIKYYKKFGMADIENNRPIKFNHLFSIASMTKPIVTVAMLLLSEEGHFSLYDPISKFIPKASELKVFKDKIDDEIILEDLKREITFLDILTHSAGFMDMDYNHPLFHKLKEMMDNNIFSSNLADFVDLFLKLPLKAQPGTSWLYGFSFEIVGRIIEIISKQSLDTFLKDRIFSKLEMNDTDYYVTSDKLERVIPVYSFSDNKLTKLRDFNQIIIMKKERPSYISGSGGLSSTISDYLKFSEMLVNNGNYKGVQFLKKESIDLMMQNYLIANGVSFENGIFRLYKLPSISNENLIEYLDESGHGLGIEVTINDNKTPKGIGGWSGALNTVYWVDRKNKIIGILFSQYSPYCIHPIFSEFRELSYRCLNI